MHVYFTGCEQLDWRREMRNTRGWATTVDFWRLQSLFCSLGKIKTDIQTGWLKRRRQRMESLLRVFWLRTTHGSKLILSCLFGLFASAVLTELGCLALNSCKVHHIVSLFTAVLFKRKNRECLAQASTDVWLSQQLSNLNWSDNIKEH